MVNEPDVMVLGRAAEIVRRDMFENKTVFNGTFGSSCQSNSVPDKLQALVIMILEGPNKKIK